MKKKILVFVIVLILLVVLVYFGLSKTGLFTLRDNQNQDEKIKIGIMTPLTGSNSFLGENIVRSAELAIKELGYENKVQLIIEDSGQLASGNFTTNAYNKLVHVDNVKIIIDGMTSDGTMAIAPLLKDDKVVMITPLTGGANIDLSSEYLFRNGPSDIIAGTRPADELYNKFNYKKVVLFTDNAEYTLDIANHFIKEYKGEVVLNQIVFAYNTDYRTEVSKLMDLDFDVILITSQEGSSAGYIIKALKEQGIDYPIFMNFLGYTDNSIKIAGKESFEGLYVYDPEFDEELNLTINFLNQYKNEYGVTSPIKFHSTGTYDAIKMYVEAVNNVGYDGEKIHNYLLDNIKNWKGMNGVVSFDENGNTETGFVLKQIRNGELVNR